MRVCCVRVISNTTKMDTDHKEARDAIIRAVAETTGKFTMDQIAEVCGQPRGRVRLIFRSLRDAGVIRLTDKRRGGWVKTGAYLTNLENKPPVWDRPEVDVCLPSIVDRAIASRPLLVVAFDAAVRCQNG